MKAFLKEYYTEGNKVILYGAAMYGALALNSLTNMGIPVTVFCDRVQAGAVFQGKSVIKPENLKEKEYEDSIVLVCATKGFEGIQKYLNDINVQRFYHIGEILKNLNCDTLEAEYKELSKEELIEKYMFYVENISEYRVNCNKKLELPFVALSITEKCNLRCKKCSVLAPYYKKPQNDSYNEIIEPFERFLNCIDSIAELQLGGGEPFLHPDLCKILMWCINQKKIREISIFTNSTVLPNEKLMILLKNSKVKLLLDDYGVLSTKFNEIKNICETEKIRYVVQKFLRWDDLGEFDVRNESEATVTEKFKYCSFGNVNSFLKGKFQRCTTAARIMDIGLIDDDESDYINFNDEQSQEIWKDEIEKMLFERKFHKGCFLCNGISTNQLGIKVAEQL